MAKKYIFAPNAFEVLVQFILGIRGMASDNSEAISTLSTDKAANTEVTAIKKDMTSVESSATANQSYIIGDYLIYNNQIYTVTSNIAKGARINPGQNCKKTSIGKEISAYNQSKARAKKIASTLCDLSNVSLGTNSSSVLEIRDSSGDSILDNESAVVNGFTETFSKEMMDVIIEQMGIIKYSLEQLLV